jgi:hypothetical protein
VNRQKALGEGYGCLCLGGNPFDYGGEPILQDQDQRHEHEKFGCAASGSSPYEPSLSDAGTRIPMDGPIDD